MSAFTQPPPAPCVNHPARQVALSAGIAAPNVAPAWLVDRWPARAALAAVCLLLTVVTSVLSRSLPAQRDVSGVPDVRMARPGSGGGGFGCRTDGTGPGDRRVRWWPRFAGARRLGAGGR